MSKINQEEYEEIKLLPDYDWNWIAREKTGKILSFTNKPTKTDEVWKDKQTRLWFNYKDSQLFQFIQWEDENPYNIAELIEEYEFENVLSDEERFYELYNVNKSEETEVKNVSDVIEKVERNINVEGRPDNEKALMRLILNDLEKLDEPEALSQDWIDEHAQGGYGEWVYTEDLQNLLVPRQEEVDRAYKDGYEKGKQHTFYKGYLEGLGDKGSEPETVADVLTTFWKSYERLKKVMNMEVEELEE